ncbi:SDR family oxidoreductase [Streptomyces flavofungini]|uniref:SDR family oxidoreductase n=1 Tax=Streptomyces flavofungini TaxID=68200 RepID=A0ABS0XBG0_9ACTN|nr:SDR family oxidoreductase [Streptomyces flavofungini]MBJ3810351.1 SDR family oxidoreductase [Streptomyces flavofungini]MBJ3811975.1 SDR family oxidoreductase [Streptomyces flavofungini]GHC51135.1 NAD(P)-dependent oxidoreductase [Streptomyces flavofungini]
MGTDGQRDAQRLRCLVTGASGYIGGRLVPELLDAGHHVRCLARSPAKLRDHPWATHVEVAQGDVTDAASLAEAMRGIDVAYYLVHALASGSDFEETDRLGARNFAERAYAAGVRRIVYLGGLTSRGVPASDLSPHLRSRAEVGQIFLDGPVPATVLQAAVVIGSGSASFEMLRYLTERLPVMVTPSWVHTRTQPIGVRDVLRYLVGSATMPADVDRAFDIGGPDVLTYREMMRAYARVAGLRQRLIVPVPVLTPGLSSHWVGLVTPVPAAIARPLTQSLRHEVVCHEHDIAKYVPDLPGRPLPFGEALALALRRVRDAQVATRWSSASVPGAPSDPLPTDPDWAGGSLYEDERQLSVEVSRQALWKVIEGIGGDNGWYSLPIAWAVRGWLDRFVGGVGLRRGRRDAERLRVGDSLDFWRVEEIEPGRLLRLRAEMRLPGLAWLEMHAETDEAGRTRYRQRALFHPRGLLGHAYWWSVAPFHALVFGGMARNIARAAAKDRSAPHRGPVRRRRGGPRGRR